MTDYLNGLDKLEQEIAHYRSRFQQSSVVLDDLAKVRNDFDSLTHKYEELKGHSQQITEYVNEAKTYLNNLKNESQTELQQIHRGKDELQQQFDDLSASLDVKWHLYSEKIEKILNALQAESKDTFVQFENARAILSQQFQQLEQSTVDKVTQVQDELNKSFSELESDNGKKWNSLQQDNQQNLKAMEEKFETILATKLQSWEESLQAVQTNLTQVNEKLEATSGLIKTANADTKNLQEQINKNTDSFKEVNQRTAQNESLIFIVAGVGFVCTIILALLPFFLQAKSNSQYQTPPAQVQKRR